jgi:hypothetical protein
MVDQITEEKTGFTDYEGNYSYDIPGGYTGLGTLIEGGIKYVGGFKDGQQTGVGIEIYSEGRYYVGEFKNGSYEGLGTAVAPNEEVTWIDEYNYVDGKAYERDSYWNKKPFV